MRLDGAYYVFLFHICQAGNGVDYAKFAADFIEIQYFMLLLRVLRGCRHISTYMDVCFWGVFIRHGCLLLGCIYPTWWQPENGRSRNSRLTLFQLRPFGSCHPAHFAGGLFFLPRAFHNVQPVFPIQHGAVLKHIVLIGGDFFQNAVAA